MTPQTLWPPRSILACLRPARVCPLPPSPTSRLAVRPVRSGFAARPDRSRAPRHPPPGCRLAATAAHRAALDQEDAAVRISAGVCYPFQRRSVRTLPIYSIRYSAIGDMETCQNDTRFAENGDINAPGAARRSLSGTHFARKGPTSATG